MADKSDKRDQARRDAHGAADGRRLEGELGRWLASRERGQAPDRLRLRVARIAESEPRRRATFSAATLLRPVAALGAAALVAALAVTALWLRGSITPQASAPPPSPSIVPSASFATTWPPVDASPLPTAADLVTWMWYLGWLALGLLALRLLILGPSWSPARWGRTGAGARGQGDQRNESTEPILSLYTRAIGGPLRHLGSDPDDDSWTPEEAPVQAGPQPREGRPDERLAGLGERLRSALTGRASSCLLGLGIVSLFLSSLVSIYMDGNEARVLVPAQVEMNMPGAPIISHGTVVGVDGQPRPAVSYGCQRGADVRVRFAMRNTAPVPVQVRSVRVIGDPFYGELPLESEVLLPPGPTMEALPLLPTEAGPWYSEPMRPFELRPDEGTTLGLVLRLPYCWYVEADAVQVRYTVLGFAGVGIIPLPEHLFLGGSLPEPPPEWPYAPWQSASPYAP